jgi:4-hydroxyacetophenone monooxygenase
VARLGTVVTTTFLGADELGSVDAARIGEVVRDAHLPTLLVTLAYLTGDPGLLAPEFRPSTVSVSLGMDPTGGLSPDACERARRNAVRALLAWREHRHEPPRRSDGELLELMQFLTGPVSPAYVSLLVHELGLSDDVGAPSWTKDELAPDRRFTVAVIGAGMSGLVAARRLGQAGIPFVVFERQDDVGGVWQANRYPGARLDTSNFTYTYSFAQRHWDDCYSPRDDVLDYLRSVSDDLDLRRHIRFGTAVEAARFDPDSSTWTLTIREGAAESEEITVNAVISAVGQLSEPLLPDLPGRRRFTGPSWHTAQWDDTVDIHGARVALIGTGASAFQVVPHMAEHAAELTIFQRTPAWVLPTPGYTAKLPDGLRWLLANLPHYHRWYRFMQFWLNVDGIRHLAVVDPDWHHEGSVSEANQGVRQRLESYLAATFADRPDLLTKLTPDYPPYAKRTLRDDGTWSGAMKRDNVRLVTEPIAEVTERGICTADGEMHEVDVIVYGTGFRASEFLASIRVTGYDGRTLDEYWEGDARAYYGITIPNFPNLFCLYGPNTNLNTNGSVVLFSEAAVEYILGCLRHLLTTGKAALQVRPDVVDAHSRALDEASRGIAIGASTVNSWYKNKFGRVSQNWPLPTLDYWLGTREPYLADFELLPRTT